MKDRSSARAASLPVLDYGQRGEGNAALLKQLLALAGPVLLEHALHVVVNLTDTYLANHLRTDRADATAAIGTIAYFLWLFALLVSAIATGSTALIARARGMRHRGLANAATGQSVLAAVVLGCALAVVIFTTAPLLVRATGLQGKAQDFALTYLRILAFSLPFSTVMFVANACLRGAGDTLTPALAMLIVDGVNILLATSLTWGLGPMPELGFTGIALGTAAAYVTGGVVSTSVLLAGRGGIRLLPHRMRPHGHTLRRILRVGVPSGAEQLLAWTANFAVVVVINRLDATNASPAAHVNAIRIESVSYMAGFAVATAAATMVGQSLGMGSASRATRVAYLALAVGGAIMTACGLSFILFGRLFADLISADARIAELTAQCLFVTGWIQAGFAASAIFSGALRGAGDTFAVMLVNLASIIGIRFVGVMLVGFVFGGTLVHVWMVLSGELFCRGLLMYGRFLHGGWKQAKV